MKETRFNGQPIKVARQSGQNWITHPLEPIFDTRSQILILGTMPSPKSRETGFYYGHPQNRFWKVMAGVVGQPVPVGNDEKITFLILNRIALWDVLASCRIIGADDSSIRDPIPNDLNRILLSADVKAIFTTGRKATELYRRTCLPQTLRPSTYLPSTSPANQAIPTDRLILQYQEILYANGFDVLSAECI